MNITSIISDLIMPVDEYYNNYYNMAEGYYFADNYVAKITLKDFSKEGRVYMSDTKKMENTDIIEYSLRTQDDYKILENSIFYFVVIQDAKNSENLEVPDVIFNTKDEALNWLKKHL